MGAIKGEDAAKPVVLFLHGEPGSVMSPYKDIYSEWESPSTIDLGIIIVYYRDLVSAEITVYSNFSIDHNDHEC